MVHHREEDRIGIPFPNHSSDVLCSLNEQRRNGLLCDVVLVVRDQEYRSHRSVLAACSHYFKKLFTVANGEDGGHHHAAAPTPSAAIYEIDFVAPESLTAILEFAYTSTLTVTPSNVSEILNAAQMLEIPCIINVCLEIMDSGEGGGGGSEGREEEEVEEDEEEEEEEDEDGSRNDDQEEDDDRSSESRGEPLGMDESPPPSTSTYQERSPDSMRGKQESLENRALKDFSIESLLQDGLYPRMSALDRRASFSPLLPSFYPSMWAADFPAFPQRFLEPGLHQHPRTGAGSPRVPTNYPTPDAPPPGPLDLVVKREIIKEEMKEEVLPGLLHGNFLKEFVNSGLCSAMGSTGPVPPSGHALGAVKDEADFRSYLSFLNSTSHLGALFPPWQLEEERKMKPKSSQQCPICNKIIQGAGKLPRHMRTHTGEKPYMCTICEVRFTRQDKLKIHMRKHTGERPYICLHCNSKFVHNYDLKNHLRIHTGVRPYQCEHCYKSFTRSDHLHRHLKRQSCRVSRPRRGRKPAAWRSVPTASYMCPPNTATAAGVLEGNGFKSYQDGEEKDGAERQRGVFAFSLAGDDVLARSPFYSAASDPWTVRLERAPPIPETAT
ncbi:zinc finger and BTB domain-containing protein 7C isoform X2 [Phyllopteryx taeniolatus]|nr:zinc finger and BTB domain-containing protein 7C isoform X2 [Phyllopteryx taeniolatus]XP_061603263.1 zinc finger and BTB domain-containing protein 7C isoform X2 [Phyllopteryx taeniolatus]XP_061603264.1 zinc finger and BTB domain-containing protein 7C isoform X2 [Phyllopteryx taeniolatus]